MEKKGNWALVVAAGKGGRLGLPYNKVFHRLAGRSVLSRCFDALTAADCFEGAVLVLSSTDGEMYQRLLEEEGKPTLVRRVAVGGGTRQQSVANGLAALPDDAKVVAIHDCARAFVPLDVVQSAVQSAVEHGSGVAATPVSDTIKRVDEQGQAVETLDRELLRAVQTPQAFQVELIKKAHQLALIDLFEATDDAALVERYIGPVRLCCLDAGKQNIKLTTKEDMDKMEARLLRDLRVGHGFDVHKLVPDRKLILCGVLIPHERGLLGHSDADVATHALMDALLGAVALGDIGQQFPDTDPKYKGADSIALLRRVLALLKEHGYAPHSCDVTIACERPKLAPHRQTMRENLAAALGISIESVNVKATTTEGLGFEGRGEGISATAIASLRQIDREGK